MPFHDRDYEVFLVLGAPESPPLWRWAQWRPFAQRLDALTGGHRGKAALRSLQYSLDGKPVAFGRLAWDMMSGMQWAHVEPSADHADIDRIFLDVEAWAPSWNVCRQENRAPDFFFALYNESADRPPGGLHFNQRIVCAIAADEDAGRIAALRTEMAGLAAALEAPLFARTRRPWGISTAGGGFTDSLQDMHLLHLFKGGDLHARPLDPETFSEPWVLIGTGEA